MMASENIAKKFVVEFIDGATGCIREDLAVDQDDVFLRHYLSVSAGTPVRRAVSITDAESTREIADHYHIDVAESLASVRVRPWRESDGLPYKLHTNRELMLMLACEKPMAAFVEDIDNAGQGIIPEEYFGPYVSAGRFARRESMIEIDTDRTVRYVLYAKPDQQWRMDAYLLLKRTALVAGWSEGFERLEGSLLGYQDWQNDAYIELVYRRA